jgi:hypothetical protein
MPGRGDGASPAALRAYGPAGQVRRVLDLTGLFDAGLVFDTREEALAAYRQADAG